MSSGRGGVVGGGVSVVWVVCVRVFVCIFCCVYVFVLCVFVLSCVLCGGGGDCFVCVYCRGGVVGGGVSVVWMVCVYLYVSIIDVCVYFVCVC